MFYKFLVYPEISYLNSCNTQNKFKTLESEIYRLDTVVNFLMILRLPTNPTEYFDLKRCATLKKNPKTSEMLNIRNFKNE